MRWTEEQLTDHLAKRSAAPVQPYQPAHRRHFALGRLPTGTMNKTERAYSEHLEAKKSRGDILWYRFEGVKLRLADNTFYTCDFAVLPADGVLEMHEIKGFMMDDANVKIKVAAASYPFRFLIIKVNPKKNGGGWARTEVSA